jgi:ribonuclease HI
LTILWSKQHKAIQPCTLYFDSYSHKNGTRVGVFILSPLNIPTKFKYKIKDFCSNNDAEYDALIVGLEILLGLGAKNVVIKGDSELVEKQLTKEYKCISENLLSYFVSANSLLSNFESVSFQHVPRIENQVANNLAQVASGYKISTQKLQELIKIKDKLVPIEYPLAGFSMTKHVGARKGLDFCNP